MKDMNGIFHVVPHKLNVVKSNRGILQRNLQRMRPWFTMRESKHRVGGNARDEIERSDGFFHAIDAQHQWQAIDPF